MNENVLLEARASVVEATLIYEIGGSTLKKMQSKSATQRS